MADKAFKAFSTALKLAAIKRLEAGEAVLPLARKREGEMTGLNEPIADLIVWCGRSYFLLSACEFGIGFLAALAFGYIPFRVSKRFLFGGLGPLSSEHFSLLFASTTWGLFLTLLSGKLGMLTMGLPAFQLVLLITVFLAPISVFVGIPIVLLYVFKRPVLRSRVVHIVAISIIALSYLYLVLFNKAFDGSS